ncbi:AAA family ATPase [Microbacterium halotolerans]|uniref:AAA family ATPase n=1 Tax=Microbacterium halotolerans TaxID=246613 RepID=UPI000E6AA1E9|nr:AAA family ATPase [Microbacterium halotolerans]
MTHEHSASVVLVAGPAGSGKSTLGGALAADLGAALLDLDVVTNPVLDRLQAERLFGDRHWNDASLRPLLRPARYAALRDTMAAQTVSTVAVAPWTAELAGGEEWRVLVDSLGGEPFVVWLRAGSELLARRRENRGLDRDAHIVDGGSSPAVAHIAVDAAAPTADQVRFVVERLTSQSR